MIDRVISIVYNVSSQALPDDSVALLRALHELLETFAIPKLSATNKALEAGSRPLGSRAPGGWTWTLHLVLYLVLFGRFPSLSYLCLSVLLSVRLSDSGWSRSRRQAVLELFEDANDVKLALALRPAHALGLLAESVGILNDLIDDLKDLGPGNKRLACVEALNQFMQHATLCTLLPKLHTLERLVLMDSQIEASTCEGGGEPPWVRVWSQLLRADAWLAHAMKLTAPCAEKAFRQECQESMKLMSDQKIRDTLVARKRLAGFNALKPIKPEELKDQRSVSFDEWAGWLNCVVMGRGRERYGSHWESLG